MRIEAHETPAVTWSFSYFFALLCSYYIVRPMRDEMGVTGGVENLQWLFSATFLTMLAAVPLFGWVSSRLPRRQFLLGVYSFFIANVLLFFALFQTGAGVWAARAFFVWASVFNLFVVSVFWSFMADLFDDEQARRLFGFIAAGGSAGAIAGPTITSLLAVPLGPDKLLLVSACFLGWALLCIARLTAWLAATAPATTSLPQAEAGDARALGGGILSGIVLVTRSPYLLGICVLMLLYTLLSTFLYLVQAQIIGEHFAHSAERTAVFAAIDLAVNVLTIAIQVLLTGRLVKWLGLPTTLMLVPLLLCAGFATLGLVPAFGVLVAVQIVRRAGNYAVMRPAREMLFVVLGREEKYKAKNFIDTAVYRGGDAVSAWLYAGLRAMGLGLGGIAWLAVTLAAVWAWTGYRLGKRQMTIAASIRGVAPGTLPGGDA